MQDEYVLNEYTTVSEQPDIPNTVQPEKSINEQQDPCLTSGIDEKINPASAAGITARVFSTVAPALRGESLIGSSIPASGTVAKAASAVTGFGQLISGGFKNLFRNIGSIFKEPKKLIPLIAVVTVWLIINIMNGAGFNPLPVKALSFLTFASGGTTGGILGFLGGLFGKAAFAGALVSLIGMIGKKKTAADGTKEKRSFGDTLKKSFGVNLSTLFPYLTGIGVALLAFLFISGGNTRMAFMAGTSCSYLTARSVLNNGLLKKLLLSVFAKKSKSADNIQKDGSENSKTISSRSRNLIEGFMRGTAAGFAASSVIGLTGIKLIPVILGSLLIVGGGVMLILQATGAVKFGKEAEAK